MRQNTWVEVLKDLALKIAKILFDKLKYLWGNTADRWVVVREYTAVPPTTPTPIILDKRQFVVKPITSKLKRKLLSAGRLIVGLQASGNDYDDASEAQTIFNKFIADVNGIMEELNNAS